MNRPEIDDDPIQEIFEKCSISDNEEGNEPNPSK